MIDFTVGKISETSFNDISPGRSKKADGFGEAIKNAIQKVDSLETEANDSIINLLKGNADVNETMIALQKADISMRMLLTVRNKVLDAYREIMRMQF
jgi:flagellar hook-basal body complex protein FliE